MGKAMIVALVHLLKFQFICDVIDIKRKKG